MARIEIIDDDAAVRDSLALVLEAEGFDVCLAEAGDIGVALARDFHPDLILTDIIMPGCEGIETIITIRGEHPRIRIIAMSGGGRIGNRDYLELAREMGADAALEKPFDEEALLEAIRTQLELRRAMRQSESADPAGDGICPPQALLLPRHDA